MCFPFLKLFTQLTLPLNSRRLMTLEAKNSKQPKPGPLPAQRSMRQLNKMFVKFLWGRLVTRTHGTGNPETFRYSRIIAVFIDIKINDILRFQRISAILKHYRKFRKVRNSSDKLGFPQRLAEISENQFIYLRKKSADVTKFNCSSDFRRCRSTPISSEICAARFHLVRVSVKFRGAMCFPRGSALLG